MINDLEYALMAGRAYFSTREPENRFPDPSTFGWSQIAYTKNDVSGFEAIAFKRGSEVVISYAGTYPKQGGDLAADADLGAEIANVQMSQTAAFYQQVKQSNSGASFSFTGHSLGGGLAALMGVFFNQTAVTFDSAPFRKAATTTNSLLLQGLLSSAGYPSDSDLASFASLEIPVPGLDPVLNIRGESNVRNIAVQGEFLSTTMSDLLRIAGSKTVLTHGSPDASGTDLHSLALLTEFLQNSGFQEVTRTLKALIPAIFDKSLYAFDTDTVKENFMERLVRHQAGVPAEFTSDAMLDRFTSEMETLAQPGGLTMTNVFVNKALIAAAIEAYYFKKNDDVKPFFDNVTGGVRFNLKDIGADWNSSDKKSSDRLLVATQLLTSTAQTGAFLTSNKPSQWYVQAGSAALAATASSSDTSAMLGGTGNDQLTGNAGNDLLYGGSGDDALDGGAGQDYLAGDKGYDTYQADTGDQIFDIDGQGRVYYKGVRLTGGIEGEQKGVFEGDGFKYILAGDGKSVRVIAGDGSITVSTGRGNFHVISVWEQIYMNGEPVRDPYYRETIGNPEDASLGIVLWTGRDPKPGDPGKPGDVQPLHRRSAGGCCDPFILDLDGDGIQTTALSISSPFFDIAADGFAEQTGWVSPKDGLLVVDRNKNGRIDDGGELFGEGVKLSDGSFAKDGYEALRALDSNYDGKIDALDSAYTTLEIWQDADGDAQTDAGELKSLAQAGVQSISLDGNVVGGMNNGNIIAMEGHYTRSDGTVLTAGDVVFTSRPYQGADNALTEDPEIATLPDIGGSGSVPTLRAAMRAADGAALNACNRPRFLLAA